MKFLVQTAKMDDPMSLEMRKTAYRFWEEEYPGISATAVINAIAQSDMNPEDLVRLGALNREIRTAVKANLIALPDEHYDDRPRSYDRDIHDEDGGFLDMEEVPIDYTDRPIIHANSARVTSMAGRLKTAGNRVESGRIVVRPTTAFGNDRQFARRHNDEIRYMEDHTKYVKRKSEITESNIYRRTHSYTLGTPAKAWDPHRLYERTKAKPRVLE